MYSQLEISVRYSRPIRRFWQLTSLSLLFLAWATSAQAQPSFSKTFNPDTIGPGSISTLIFDIFNESQLPVTTMAFTDTLPAGLVIATPANSTSTCGGTVGAPDGGATISFSDGILAANSGCTITIDVTGNGGGTYTNISGDLTSDAGSSGSATDDLTIDIGRPGFSKNFSPDTIDLGGRSTLTFTIDNSANEGSGAFNLSFTDNLPAGMVVADPANASTSCTDGIISTVPGGGVISYSTTLSLNAAVDALSSCIVTVDVVGTAVGSLINVTGELNSATTFNSPTSTSGKTSAVLNVTTDPISLTKSFSDDPVPPGGTVTLDFTIRNLNRADDATDITFSDDLDAVLSGLTAVGLPLADPCGAGSSLTGTSLLTLTGGDLMAESSCNFSVMLQVPVLTDADIYSNTTSPIQADVNGEVISGSAATDDLFVEPAPLLTKTFLDNPVGAGDTVTLEFTISNTSTTSSADDITFDDVFFVGLPTAVTIPANDFCGPGSTAVFIPLSNPPPPSNATPARLIVSGANLAAGASCTFSITLNVSTGVATGIYSNITSPVSASVDNVTFIGDPAADDLEIVAAPDLNKTFTDDPVQPGDNVTLEFTLTHDPNAPAAATAIAFTDDLEATLSGLVATGLPVSDLCGAGSQLTGTSILSFTGGTLAVGESCTFSVILQVPAVAPVGSHINTTGNVSALVSGVATTENPASDNLNIAGLNLTKTFTDDPVIPGDTVTLQFTIQNDSPTQTASNIFFQDDLDDVIDNLSATGLPLSDICGAGSSLSATAGNTFLTFSGGSLAPAASCTFDVVLQVPAVTASDVYTNTTRLFQATVDAATVPFDNASDELVVTSDLLSLSKSFTDDPVAPGASVTLEFVLSNLDPSRSATDIGFTDDLDAVLAGMTATGLPATDICGAGSQISGTGTLTFSGGSLAAGASCTFSIPVAVPADVALGSIVTNTTSQVTGTIDGLAVSGDPASAGLSIKFLNFSKSFSGPAFAGGNVTLSFTIENLSATDDVTGIGFNDDLSAVLAGLTAGGLPLDDVCGSGSQLSGSSLLLFSGGSLSAQQSCSFSVTLQVPVSAAPGVFTNTTSELLLAGLSAANPASDELSIEPPPQFSKNFVPDATGFDIPLMLSFTIDNSASALAADNLDFTDNLPAGIIIATPANASTSCSGGTLTAVAGSGNITYSGGSVAAGASCEVQLNVISTTAGIHVNTTGALTSSSGASGTASATLTVNQPPLFSKTFTPASVISGGISTLTFVIDNSNSTAAANSLSFADNLPPGLSVASIANASTSCSGGTLQADAGDQTISYINGAVSAQGSCTVQMDVIVTRSDGTAINTSGDLISSLGNSGPASATIDVSNTLFKDQFENILP